jgi:hypothetical protein
MSCQSCRREAPRTEDELSGEQEHLGQQGVGRGTGGGQPAAAECWQSSAGFGLASCLLHGLRRGEQEHLGRRGAERDTGSG